MKQKVISCGIAILLCGTALAQNYKEVVYLKNGSIIYGVVIEQIPDKTIKIKTADGSLFVYQMSEVEKISKEEVHSNHEGTSYNYKKASSKKPFNNGYRGMVDVTYGASVGEEGDDMFSITTSHGYQFNPYLFLGGGMGISSYRYSGFAQVPVFCHFKANFMQKKVSPYADIKLGYSSGDCQGVYFSPSFGARVSLGRRLGLHAGLSYTLQQAEILDSYPYYNYFDITISSLGLKVGFEF